MKGIRKKCSCRWWLMLDFDICLPGGLGSWILISVKQLKRLWINRILNRYKRPLLSKLWKYILLINSWEETSKVWAACGRIWLDKQTPQIHFERASVGAFHTTADWTCGEKKIWRNTSFGELTPDPRVTDGILPFVLLSFPPTGAQVPHSAAFSAAPEKPWSLSQPTEHSIREHFFSSFAAAKSWVRTLLVKTGKGNAIYFYIVYILSQSTVFPWFPEAPVTSIVSIILCVWVIF